LSAPAEGYRTRRVIALVPPGISPPLPSSVRAVVTHNGYEAAAELLATAARVLLVDLSRITSIHAPLLGLARRAGVAVVAFGSVAAPIGGEALSHVRLVPAGQAAQAVAEALGPAGDVLPVGGGVYEPESAEAPAKPAPADARRPRRRPGRDPLDAELDAMGGDGP